MLKTSSDRFRNFLIKNDEYYFILPFGVSSFTGYVCDLYNAYIAHATREMEMTYSLAGMLIGSIVGTILELKYNKEKEGREEDHSKRKPASFLMPPHW